jgi:hypothetical protein
MARSDRVVVHNHIQDIAFVVEKAASAACDSSSSDGTKQLRQHLVQRDARRRSMTRYFHVLSASASIDFKSAESSKKPLSSKEFKDSSTRPGYEDRGLGRGNREAHETSKRRPELGLLKVEAVVLLTRGHSHGDVSPSGVEAF